MSTFGDEKSAPSLSSGGGGEEKGGKRVVTEEPTMRAVAIMSKEPVLHDSLQVQRPTLGFVSPPPKGLFGPAPTKGDFKSRSEGSSSLRVKQEWSKEITIPCNWAVPNDCCLAQVPYPLERTHREIHETPDKVASRISGALRELSIEAEFNSEEAKAKCRTKDFVSFRIRLYAGGQDGQPVVVEVQRRSGPGRCFMRSCRAILCAAEGNSLAAMMPTKHPGEKCRVMDMKCLQGAVEKPTPVEDCESLDFSLNKAIDLLRMQQLDSRRLGMEYLGILTDPIKTRPASARRVAKLILMEENKFNVREDLTVVLERDTVTPEFGQTPQGDASSLQEQLRHLALNAISNALTLTSLDACLKKAFSETEWFGDFLIPTLMEELRNAERYPNNAYVASCCLNTLMTCSSVVCGIVKRDEGAETVRRAHSIGKQRHEALANETERCMKTLELFL